MKRLTISDVEAIVAGFYKLHITALRQKSSQRKDARPRQVAFFFCRELTPASFPKIGAHFGKHHSTVLHGARLIGRLAFSDFDLQLQLEGIRDRASLAVPSYERARALVDSRPLVEVANV